MLYLCFLPSIEMCLKLGEIKLNKKEFCKSKQPMYLNQVEISNIVISDEFKLDDSVKNFSEYKNGGTVKPLCNILPEMGGFIKYFEKKKTKEHVIFSY